MIARSKPLAAKLHGGLRRALDDGRRRAERLGRPGAGSSRRPEAAGVVHARLRRDALESDRHRDRAGEASGADLLPGPDRGTCALDPRAGRLRGPRRRCGLRRPATAERRHPPVARERQRRLEAAAAAARPRGAVLGQAVRAVASGRRPAQLHARQGHRRRRRDLHRQLQPLAGGREERRERARIRGRGARQRLGAYIDDVRARYPSFTFAGA